MTGERDRHDRVEARLRQRFSVIPAVLPAEVTEAVARRTAREPQVRSRRGQAVLLVAAAALAVVAVAGIGGLMADPSPEPLVSPSPVASPSAPSPAARPSGSGLSPGMVVRATDGLALDGPDWTIQSGQLAYVVEGPVPGQDGEPSRYRLQTWGDLTTGLRPDTIFGWADAGEAESILVAAPPDCPDDQRVTLSNIAALQPFERLACFGGAELTFGPVTVRESHVGGTVGEPAWLATSSTTWLSVDGEVDFFTALPARADPRLDQPLEIGPWYAVTGRFDHPDASDCGGREWVTNPLDPPRPGDVALGETARDSILWCQEQFVVTGLTTVERPATELAGAWRQIAAAPLDGRTGHSGVWTGSEAIFWGGQVAGGATADGGAYDPTTDTWRTIALPPIDGRWGHLAVWTGREMIVWGGFDIGDTPLPDGAAYDPAADRWRLLPVAPFAGGQGAWTGSELVVVGDVGAAALDPADAAWRLLDDHPGGPNEIRSVAWSGTELLLLRALEGEDVAAVAQALDVATGRWRDLAETPLDSLSAGPIRWVGDRAVVIRDWPLRSESGLVASAEYDPASESWRIIEGCDIRDPAVWTGSILLSPEEAWDPASGDCLKLPLAPERPGLGTRGREFFATVWTGEELIAFSGGTGSDVGGWPADGVAFRPEF